MGDPEAVVAILEPASDSAIETPGPAPHERAPGRTSAVVSPYHNWRSPKVITSAVSASLLLLGWLIRSAGGAPRLVEACAIAAILSGAFYFGRKALLDLIVHRSIGFYFLMSAAAVVSALIGHAQEGAILVFLTSISEAAQDFTEWKTRSAIHALMNLAPKTALVQRGERTEEIPVEELVVGDLFIVKPGAAIATDGVVVEGTSDVNQAPITGESQPVTKEPGDSRLRRQHQRTGRPQGPGHQDVRRQHGGPDHPDGRGGAGKERDQPAIHRAVRGKVQSDRGAGRDPGRRAPSVAVARRLDDLDHPGDGADGGCLAVRRDDLDSGHARCRPRARVRGRAC